MKALQLHVVHEHCAQLPASGRLLATHKHRYKYSLGNTGRNSSSHLKDAIHIPLLSDKFL